MKSEPYVMMDLMIILLQLHVMNFMANHLKLYHGKDRNNAMQKDFGQMMLYVKKEEKEQINAAILNGDSIIAI